MSIKFNGATVTPSFENLQPTDFSKVTAHPEFVLKGKTFYDETGQLREGALKLSGVSVNLQDKEATPSAAAQNIEADDGFDGLRRVVVAGDENLKAENIAEGVSIFGVTGTHAGGGENKLVQVLSKTVTEITEKDLEGVTEILADLFLNCSKLSSVTLPSSIKKIGSRAFYGTKITSITFPNLVSLVDAAVLSHCLQLENVVFGAGVTTMYNNVVNGCTSLKRIVMKATTPPSIQSGTFNGIPEGCVIEVPVGSGAAYRAATNWSTYASIIVEEGGGNSEKLPTPTLFDDTSELGVFEYGAATSATLYYETATTPLVLLDNLTVDENGYLGITTVDDVENALTAAGVSSGTEVCLWVVTHADGYEDSEMSNTLNWTKY